MHDSPRMVAPTDPVAAVDVTNFNYDNLDPARREHFVYRCFGADGLLLYIGCTMNPERRRKEHAGQSRWWNLAVRFTLAGPYNYETARRMERDAIRAESPVWNFEEPKRRRIYALQRRVRDRRFALGYDLTGTTDGAYDEMDRGIAAIPDPPRSRCLTDLDVARATKADRLDAQEVEQKRRMNEGRRR